MKVNRIALVEALEKVWPAVGRNALVPKYQSFTFHNGRVQATGGALWIDAPLPDFPSISCCVEAEPFMKLLAGMRHKEVDLEIEETRITVKASKVESEFTITKAEPTEVPTIEGGVDLSNLEDLIRGLEFCRFGVCRDETMGALCGVQIDGSTLWACDRYRILRWNMEKPVDLKCSLPMQFLERLVKMHTQIVAMEYKGDPVQGGSLNVQFEDGTIMWGVTLTGEYPDLATHFPSPDQAETIQLDSEFPAVLDRHLTFLKDVPAIDKEVVFNIEGQVCKTHGQKTTVGKKVDRKLVEETALEQPREGESFEFRINPVLLKDVMGLCWSFKFFTGATVVLFETPKFQYLVQTRG